MWLDVYVPRFPWLRWLEGAVGVFLAVDAAFDVAGLWEGERRGQKERSV